MSEPKTIDGHWSEFPEIPEVNVEYKAHVFDDGSKGLMADPVVLDLGVLGKWELGRIALSDMEDIPLEEQKAEIRKEAQVALQSLLLRFAAVALVKRGEGLAPIMSWYEGASRKEAEDERGPHVR